MRLALSWPVLLGALSALDLSIVSLRTQGGIQIQNAGPFLRVPVQLLRKQLQGIVSGFSLSFRHFTSTSVESRSENPNYATLMPELHCTNERGIYANGDIKVSEKGKGTAF